MGRTSDARQRLMDAAYDLIWEYSYGAVTIDAICERAGVKKGSFYYFFDSKSELAVAAIDAWWVERKMVLEQMFRREVPPVERLRSYFDFITQRQVKSYEVNGQVLGCPLFTLGSEICTQDEQIRSRIHEIISNVSRFFEEAIVDGQAAGEIDGKNAALKARLLMAYFEGTLTRARIENDVESLRNLTADAMELIGVHAVLTV